MEALPQMKLLSASSVVVTSSAYHTSSYYRALVSTKMIFDRCWRLIACQCRVSIPLAH